MQSRATPHDKKATTPAPQVPEAKDQKASAPKPVKHQSWLGKRINGIAEGIEQNKGKIAVASTVVGIATLPYTAPGIVTAAEATYDGFDVAQDFAWDDVIVPGADFAWNDVVVPGAAATGDFLLNDAMIPGAELAYEEVLMPWVSDMDEFFGASDTYNEIARDVSILGDETAWENTGKNLFGEDTWGDWNPNTNGIGEDFRTAFGEDTWGDWNPNTNGIGDEASLEVLMYVGIAAAAGVAAFIIGALVDHFIKKSPAPAATNEEEQAAAHRVEADANIQGLDERVDRSPMSRENFVAEDSSIASETDIEGLHAQVAGDTTNAQPSVDNADASSPAPADTGLESFSNEDIGITAQSSAAAAPEATAPAPVATQANPSWASKAQGPAPDPEALNTSQYN